MCGRNEVEVCTTLAYPYISSFRTIPVLYADTRTHAPPNHPRTAYGRGQKWTLPVYACLRACVRVSEMLGEGTVV